jgi:hypothetical protein
MNDGDDALVGGELHPVNWVAFERIDGERDVGILPGLGEFG